MHNSSLFKCLITVLLITFISTTKASTAASADFTYGVIGEYLNNAHSPARIAQYGDLNISKVTMISKSDDGSFGGTQGNDTSVTIEVTFDNNSTISFDAAINWRETNGSVVNAIGIIPNPSETVNDGFVLSGNNYNKTYLLRLSTSTKLYDSESDISGNAANNANALTEIFELLNDEADSQGTGSSSADVNTSTVSASPSPVIADGTSTSTITVRLKDSSGNDVSSTGQNIALSATIGTISSVTDNGDGSYTATITSSIAGTSIISASLNGNPISDTASVDFTTPILNSAPTADNQNVSATEDTPTAISLSGSDPDGDTLTYSIVGQPANGVLSGSGNSFTYTPDTNYSGSDSFTFKVNDGTVDSNVATVSISVAPSNDTPTADNQNVSSTEDTPTAISLSGSDPDGDSLTYSIVGQPTNGQLSGSGNSFTYTPDTNYSGSDSFTFKVNDGTVDSNVATVSISVAPDNDTPTADNQNVSATEDTPTAISLSGSDPDGDTLTYSIVGQPANGQLSGSGNSFTYTPDTNYSGSDSFTFKVNDGTVDSNVATVTISVAPDNDAPTASPLSVVTDEEQDLTITLIGSDIDGDELSYSITSTPENGSLMGEGTTWIYTPIDGFSGQDSFSYIVNDGELDSNIATVTIVVNDTIEENLPPVAINDQLSITSSNLVIIDAVANDYDPEDGELIIVSAIPRFGSVSIENNQLSYTPPTGFKGAATISYSIEDDEGQIASAIITVSVNIEDESELPIISVPADLCGPLSVNSDALYTRVDYGNASAVDSLGNPVPVSVIDNVSLFPPGENIIYWKATDAFGNTAISAQKVCVNPLVSLDKDQTVIESESVELGVFLNGDSPVYPVIIPFSVSGSADTGDHTLVDGVIEIVSGTEGKIVFETLPDGIEEENETIVISLSDTLNRGAKSSANVIITEENVAPELSLTVEQAQEKRLTITNDGGLVTILASVYDPNKADNFYYSWQFEGADLENQSGDENRFIFDPSELPLGLYRVSLTVEDDALIVGDDSEFVYIEVVAAIEDLGDEDSDGDNIPDRIEGYADSDGDGIPDYLDRIDECNVLLEERSIQDGYLVESDPGTCLRRGQYSFGGSTEGAYIPEDDIKPEQDSLYEDSEAINVGGIFDFLAYGLPDEAQSAAIAIPQRNPIPANAVYRKFNSEQQWVNFVEDEHNTLMSAKGEPGYCPPPRSDKWEAGLVEGYWCVQVEIEDGGPNDDDRTINGSIVDPGFVGVLVSNNTAPSAQMIEISTEFNQTIVVDLESAIDDIDGDNLTITSATASVGQVNIVGSTLEFEPPLNFAGEIEIIYSVSDGNGGVAQAIVTISVTPPNLAPMSANVAQPVLDQCQNLQSVDVLSDATDPNGHSIEVVSASSNQGSAIVNSDGTINFSPDCNFFGTATVNYVLEDELGLQTSASFTVRVRQVSQIEAVTNSSGGGSLSILLLIGLTFVTALRQVKNAWRMKLNQCLIPVLLLLAVVSSSQAQSSFEKDCEDEQENKCHTAYVWPSAWYFNAQIGYSKTNVSQSELDQAFSSAGIDAVSIGLDKSDLSYSFGIGYQFNPYLALQLEHFDLGERELRFTGETLQENEDSYFALADEVFPETAEGLKLSLIGSVELAQKLKAIGTISYLDWKQDYKTFAPSQRGNAYRDGVDLSLGLGLAYALSDNMNAKVIFETTKLNEQRVNTLSLGIEYFPFSDDQSRKKAKKPISTQIPAQPTPETVATEVFVKKTDTDSDGVIDEDDQCENTPMIHAVDEKGCSLYVTEVKSIRLDLLFALNSSELTKEDVGKIEELANFMHSYPDASVVLEGHTDSRGSEAYNLRLSQARANAVKQSLIETFKIDEKRIEAIGYGETRLLDDANTEDAHRLNRRTVAKVSTEISVARSR